MANGTTSSFGRRIAESLNSISVVRAGKNLRNAIVDRGFSRRSRDAGRAFATHLARTDVRRPCFAVAFNTPWAIELLCAGWRRHGPGMELVVIDNSSRADARTTHQAICRDFGVPWLGLPPNPEWSPNRSHGIAMNWIWRNVVRPMEPELFGWIDHDCFPTRSLHLPSCLEDHSVYGFQRLSTNLPGVWNLWAGYCFFRFAATRGLPLDFKHRVELGLDTGGGNWLRLYRHLPAARVGTAHAEQVRIEAGDARTPITFRRIDRCFIHVGGGSYRSSSDRGIDQRTWLDTLWREVCPGEDRRHS